ncbi:hypothetical protein M8818_007519 [Zalaria obscura]|uniref:Uncharacterized protein n=1 Tax=Zalaria obscura TaxID=2024903 RepID=A0ACC3S4H5_9PEZI
MVLPTLPSRASLRSGLSVTSRLLMCALFVISGTGKLAAVDATKKYMETYGVPGYLVYPAAAFEIGSAMMLLMGQFPKELAIMLAGWCLLTAFIFHRDFDDQNQQFNFFKNLAMAGGFIVLADIDAGRVERQRDVEEGGIKL